MSQRPPYGEGHLAPYSGLVSGTQAQAVEFLMPAICFGLAHFLLSLSETQKGAVRRAAGPGCVVCQWEDLWDPAWAAPRPLDVEIIHWGPQELSVVHLPKYL